MFEFFFGMAALGTLSLTVLSVFVGLAYTVFWIWMVLDSVVRDTTDYPATGIEKVIWVILNAFVQPAFVLYYLLVYRKAAERTALRRDTVSAS